MRAGFFPEGKLEGEGVMEDELVDEVEDDVGDEGFGADGAGIVEGFAVEVVGVVAED